MDPENDRWVRSDEARTKFRDLVDEVVQDDTHVYLLRYDKPVAVMVPVDWYEAVKAKIAEGSGQ
jgi:PHD/YefM family antitoxin component YafN of YafNO toxin-antitoxin module